MASIATVLKSIQLDPGMNLPVKFHQNRLIPLASRAVHYIQTYKQAGGRHGWSLHNCIQVIVFVGSGWNFLTKRLIIVRIKAWKTIFEKIIFLGFFKNFKVPLLGNGGVHSNGAQNPRTRSWYEPTCQVSSKPVDYSGLQSCPLHTNIQTSWWATWVVAT